MYRLWILSLCATITQSETDVDAVPIPLNIKKQCGITQTFTMMHRNVNRSVSLYIPKILCNESKITNFINHKMNPVKLSNPDELPTKMSFDPSEHQMTLPMMIALHGYHCAPKMEIGSWHSMADEMIFILMAPLGIQNSWNGDHCCGYAVDHNVDDTAFLQSLIRRMQQSFSDVFPFISLYRSADGGDDGYLWLTGYSNGGFMADKLVKLLSLRSTTESV